MRAGPPAMCRQAIGRPGTPFRRDSQPGSPLYNFASASVFAERTVVKAVQAVRIDPEIPFTSAALIGCSVVTGVGAALNRARVGLGDTVAVIGCGGIGLNVIQGARIAGAARIVAIDAVAAKEAVARTFGATDFVDARAVDSTVEAVRALLPTGVDHAFECVGSTALIRQAVDLLDRHGQAVLLGMTPVTAEASFRPAELFLDKSVLGCRYGSSRPQADIPRYAALYRSGRLLLDELVTAVYPVDEFERAADDTHHARVARAVLSF